jgi:hypothetical protein
MSQIRDAHWERWLLANHAAGKTLDDVVEHLLTETSSNLMYAPSTSPPAPVLNREDLIIDNFKMRMWGKDMALSEAVNKLSKTTGWDYAKAKRWMFKHLINLSWFNVRDGKKAGRGRRGQRVFIGKMPRKESRPFADSTYFPPQHGLRNLRQSDETWTDGKKARYLPWKCPSCGLSNVKGTNLPENSVECRGRCSGCLRNVRNVYRHIPRSSEGFPTSRQCSRFCDSVNDDRREGV